MTWRLFDASQCTFLREPTASGESSDDDSQRQLAQARQRPGSEGTSITIVDRCERVESHSRINRAQQHLQPITVNPYDPQSPTRCTACATRMHGGRWYIALHVLTTL